MCRELAPDAYAVEQEYKVREMSGRKGRGVHGRCFKWPGLPDSVGPARAMVVKGGGGPSGPLCVCPPASPAFCAPPLLDYTTQ